MEKAKKLQPPGIEPGAAAWQAAILPLNQGCTEMLGFIGILNPTVDCVESVSDSCGSDSIAESPHNPVSH